MKMPRPSFVRWLADFGRARRVAEMTVCLLRTEAGLGRVSDTEVFLVLASPLLVSGVQNQLEDHHPGDDGEAGCEAKHEHQHAVSQIPPVPGIE